MAIQGKLVKQDPNDEPASVLLERIREEKTRLIKEGKIKGKMADSVIYKGSDNSYYEKVGKTEVCIDDEIPFELPDGWAWARLSTVCEMYTGDSINETEKKKKYMGHTEGRFYIGTKDVGFDHVITYDNGVRIPYEEESKFRIAPSLSTLLCVEGGSAGKKIAMLNQAVCFGNKLCCFVPHSIDETYLYYYLQSPSFISVFKSNTTGIIGGVSINTLKGLLFAIPPLSEQHRIVKKLLLLSPFIAEYNEYEQAESLLNEELPTMLRKSILQYAIQGKLVPQDPSDEPASVLLERIRTEREKANEGKKSKVKTESYIFKNSDDNSYYPFDIPESWEWVQLSEICEINPAVNDTQDDYDAAFIPMKLIDDGFNNHFQYEIKKWDDVKSGYTHFQNRDVAFAKITPCFENRKSVIMENLPNGIGAGTTELHILRAYPGIAPEYLLCFVKTPYFIDYGKEHFTGTAGQQRFGTKALANMYIPIPPTNEQKRIVEKMQVMIPIIPNSLIMRK